VGIALDLADRPGMVLVTDWVWALVARQGGARAETLLCERERGGHGAVRSRRHPVRVRVYGMAVAPVEVERGRDRRR
jgi:hypothetical protein